MKWLQSLNFLRIEVDGERVGVEIVVLPLLRGEPPPW